MSENDYRLEQTAEEVAEAMAADPLPWAEMYLETKEALEVASEKLMRYELLLVATEGEC